VQILFIEPGSPWENGYIVSFNGELRDELPIREAFAYLTEVKVMINKTLPPGVYAESLTVTTTKSCTCRLLHITEKYVVACERVVSSGRHHVIFGQFLPWLA